MFRLTLLYLIAAGLQACALNHDAARRSQPQMQAPIKVEISSHAWAALRSGLPESDVNRGIFSTNLCQLSAHIISSGETQYPLALAVVHLEEENLGLTNEVASVRFEDLTMSTGWGHLRVSASPRNDISDTLKAYAAGFLEGFCTHYRIRDYFYNSRHTFLAESTYADAIPLIRDVTARGVARIWELDQWEATSSLANFSLHSDSVFRVVQLAALQIAGITDGYNNAVTHLYKNHLPAAAGPAALIFEDLKTANLAPGDYWPALDLIDMFLLSADEDMPDLHDAARPDGVDRFRSPPRLQENVTDPPFGSRDESLPEQAAPKESEKPLRRGIRPFGRCSGLVRRTNDDLYVGHATWETFPEMNRILKYYDLPFQGCKANLVAFTSYPASLTSTDDFTIVQPTKIVTTETTVDVLDRDLFKQNSHISERRGHFPDFLRSYVASRLASSASEWAGYFADYNELLSADFITCTVAVRVDVISDAHRCCSRQEFWVLLSFLILFAVDYFLGVGTAQWLIVDYKKFQPGKLAKSDLLYVLESIPGIVVSRDATSALERRGYWGSFNRAVFKASRRALKEDDRDVPLFDRIIAPKTGQGREFTFAQLAPRVHSVMEMAVLVELNVAAKPTWHLGDLPSTMSVSPRFDLATGPGERQRAGGATDSKVVSRGLLNQTRFLVRGGPTHVFEPPFRWTDAESHKDIFDPAKISHQGMPDEWDFSWHIASSEGLEIMDPADLTVNGADERQITKNWTEALVEEYEDRVFRFLNMTNEEMAAALSRCRNITVKLGDDNPRESALLQLERL